MLCLAVALFLATGCKYSDVLTEHIEDPDIGILDETQEPTYESNPDAPDRPDLEDVTVEESDDENEQVEMLPHYDPNAPDNGPTKQRKKKEETPHDEIASEATEEGSDDRVADEGEDESDEGNEAPPEEEEPVDDNEGEGDDEEGDDELDSDEAEDPGEEPSEAGLDEEETVVVDPNAEAEETSQGTIAAVGEYATIAQMLGGAGAVVACDQAWLDSCNAAGLFPGELERVTVAFAGDGTEEGCCDVDLLIDTVQPSTVLWDGQTPALTETDRARLEEAGITIQTVPSLGEQNTEDYAVVTGVQAVASVLSGAAGLEYDPVAAAQSYVEFHDNALRTCYDANSGYSYKATDSSFGYLYQNTPLEGLSNSVTTRYVTVYVDDWWYPGVTQAEVAQTATVSGGTIRLAHDGQTLDVSDGVALSATENSSSSYMLIDYYLQLSGIMNNAYDMDKPDADGRRYIIMPGSTAAFGTSRAYASRLTGTAMFYNAGDAYVAENWHALGYEDFPAVLVATDEMAQAMTASAAKEDGLYNMENPYEVIVVPTGVAGPWTEGHVDSFLLAPWAFRIQDPGSLDVAGEYAAAFYSTFLRCEDWQGAIANWNTSYTAQ